MENRRGRDRRSRSPARPTSSSKYDTDARRQRTPPAGDGRRPYNNNSQNRPPPTGPRGRRGSKPNDNIASAAKPPSAPRAENKENTNITSAPQKAAAVIDLDEDSETEMARVMGFKDFKTTKNSKVPGNDRNYAVRKDKTSEYRQYMNRVGGFNRPLSPTRSKPGKKNPAG